VLGKFTFVPVHDVNMRRDLAPPPRHLSNDWRTRQREGALDFRLYWIPFRSEHDTPVRALTSAWREDHRVEVATVSFPQTLAESQDAKMAALLASEMGANAGNWMEEPGKDAAALPSTEYTAARALAYRKSQQERNALPEESYNAFFERGEVARTLAEELIRRYRQKLAAGHDAPDVGDVVAGG
jgi:hypothetical protein